MHDPAVYAGSPGGRWVEVVVAGVRVRVDHLHVYIVDFVDFVDFVDIVDIVDTVLASLLPPPSFSM